MSNSLHFNLSFLKLKQSEGQTFLKLLAVAVLIKLLTAAVLNKAVGWSNRLFGCYIPSIIPYKK